MINKQLEEIINKYKITKTDNIIYGTNIPMPNMVIPTPWKTYIKFDTTERYFFYFDEDGIKIYPVDGENYAEIFWKDVLDFKMSHISILGKMTVKTTYGEFKFQINRMVIGCSWIKKNREHLEKYNYFYNK